MKKIGLLGGTFDPIHNGHLHIAQTALDQLHLDEIWFIPCAQSPHRTAPHFSTDARYKMCELALANQFKFKLLDTEIRSTKQPNYTIDTVTQLEKIHPNTQFYLIIGADQFMHFAQWKDWQLLLNKIKLVVINRPSYKITTTDIPNEQVIFIEAKPCPISATEIRRNPAAHQDDLPAAVYDFMSGLLR